MIRIPRAIKRRSFLSERGLLDISNVEKKPFRKLSCLKKDLAALHAGLQIPAPDRSAQGVANLARRFAWFFLDWPIPTVCSYLDERLDGTCRCSSVCEPHRGSHQREVRPPAR
ncbi:hypothetical protein ISCGN_024069 [Ixodes scapularis]